jgi:hypothetical protein
LKQPLPDGKNAAELYAVRTLFVPGARMVRTNGMEKPFEAIYRAMEGLQLIVNEHRAVPAAC